MAKKSEPVVEALNKALADSYAAYLKTHGYHWNVRGPNFSSYHNLFMTQYTEMWTALDEIAERIRALGELAPMSGAAFGNLSSIKEGDATKSANEMLKELADGHKTLIATLKNALKVAEEASDDPTVDLLTVRLGSHEKHLWMISASLED